jgi:acyl CoA:acetate/3-ketoacid CoA transferase beta subunit
LSFKENGVLGMGPFPFGVRKMLISLTQGNKRSPHQEHPFDSALSFGMIRSKVDLTILGAMAENGDIANWKIPVKW